jgi:hypothetical protein
MAPPSASKPLVEFPEIVDPWMVTLPCSLRIAPPSTPLPLVELPEIFASLDGQVGEPGTDRAAAIGRDLAAAQGQSRDGHIVIGRSVDVEDPREVIGGDGQRAGPRTVDVERLVDDRKLAAAQGDRAAQARLEEDLVDGRTVVIRRGVVERIPERAGAVAGAIAGIGCVGDGEVGSMGRAGHPQGGAHSEARPRGDPPARPGALRLVPAPSGPLPRLRALNP